jgi:uncharacterized membrane protein
MTALPAPTLYHRWMGWHAPALRRAVIVGIIGVGVGVALTFVVRWESAVVMGWDAATLFYLASAWPIIVRANGAQTRALAIREDDTRAAITVLLIAASVASLVGVGGTLGLAGRSGGSTKILLIAVAVATVVLSWALVNTLYTHHYAHLEFQRSDGRIEFDDPDNTTPNYRDFAYLAFTIGMTYQVSDTTLKDGVMRRSVLAHALVSYLFGVVIVGGSINLIAGLVR